jgi:hypothetical protein
VGRPYSYNPPWYPFRGIHKDRGAPRKAKRIALDLAKRVAKASAQITIKIASQGLITDKAMDTVAEEFSSVGRDNFYDYIEGFEERFADVVKEYVGEKGRLVVFIDDLDRCLPEGEITVLESLKLFLDKSQCVFVIGVDQIALAETIKTMYGASAELLGRDYLDKIVQVSIPITIPSGTNLIVALLTDKDVAGLDDDVKKS